MTILMACKETSIRRGLPDGRWRDTGAPRRRHDVMRRRRRGRNEGCFARSPSSRSAQIARRGSPRLRPQPSSGATRRSMTRLQARPAMLSSMRKSVISTARFGRENLNVAAAQRARPLSHGGRLTKEVAICRRYSPVSALATARADRRHAIASVLRGGRRGLLYFGSPSICPVQLPPMMRISTARSVRRRSADVVPRVSRLDSRSRDFVAFSRCRLLSAFMPAARYQAPSRSPGRP